VFFTHCFASLHLRSLFQPLKPFAQLIKGASYIASNCHKVIGDFGLFPIELAVAVAGSVAVLHQILLWQVLDPDSCFYWVNC
jgi:hypothetical protein